MQGMQKVFRGEEISIRLILMTISCNRSTNTEAFLTSPLLMSRFLRMVQMQPFFRLNLWAGIPLSCCTERKSIVASGWSARTGVSSSLMVSKL